MSHSAPDPYLDRGPGHLEDVVLLLVVLLSAQEVLGLALSVLLEGIAPRDGTQGRVRGPALLHPADGHVPFPPRLHVNVSLVPVARNVIAVAPLPAEGGTRQATAPGHVVGALATGQVGVVEVPLLRSAENGASLDLPHRKVGGAKEAAAAAAAALVVNPPVMGTTLTLIVVA